MKIRLLKESIISFIIFGMARIIMAIFSRQTDFDFFNVGYWGCFIGCLIGRCLWVWSKEDNNDSDE